MKKKILIVDDDVHLLNLYQGALSDSFEILLATNGKEAVELAISEAPDLILMDVMMPVMDGLEALTLTKANPETSSIPVILVTANREYEDIRMGYSMGADYYITKPFTRKELVKGIELCLAKE